MKTVECQSPINQIDAHGGWWIDKLETPCGVFGSSQGGEYVPLTCPNGFIGANYNNSERTGALEMVCDGGSKSQKVGIAQGAGEGGQYIEFRCPQGQKINAITGQDFGDGVGYLSFGCVSTSQTPTNPPPTDPPPLNPPPTDPESQSTLNVFGSSTLVIFSIILIVVLVVIFLKRKQKI